jgi:hypothetical protein
MFRSEWSECCLWVIQPSPLQSTWSSMTTWLISQQSLLFLSPPPPPSPCPQTWCKHFFQSSSVVDFDRQVHISEQPLYSVLSRCNSTFHMTWAYDKEVELKLMAQ